MEVEVYRPASEAGDTEYCACCGKAMKRVWTVPEVGRAFEPYYNDGLGKVINHKSDVKTELQRIKDTEGRELVEVGNDRAHVKKKESEYKFTTAEMRDMHNMLGA